MGENLIIDSKWFFDQIIAMNEKLAALPGIETHLARQNDSISTALKACGKLDLRIIAIEMTQETRSVRWQRVLDVSLRVIEGLILAYLLANVSGIT